MNGAPSPLLLNAEHASPRESDFFPMHARWCPRGSRMGALRESRAARAMSCRTRCPDENRTRYMADGPGCWAIYPREALWARRSKPPPLPEPIIFFYYLC